ncbi:glycosyltransferase family 39 protein [Candidatus Parcubacteria bacterium]|nr:glycosyltransferase family 39 protein [Candidatus Parcubacteria bacterium]
MRRHDDAGRIHGLPSGLMKAIRRYPIWLFLIPIFSLGLFFRLFHIGFQSLWIDEVYTINAALAVLKHGYPLLDSGYIYVNNFVSVYLAALMMKIAPFDAFSPWAVRLPAALFGSGLILAVATLGRRLFKSNVVAILAAFFVTFSYNEIAWSRQARGYAALAFFLILSICFFWNYLSSGKRRDLFWWIGLFTFACLSHWSGLAFLPAFLIILWKKKYLYSFASYKKELLFLGVLVAVPIVTLFITAERMITRYIVFPFFPFFVIALSFVVVMCADHILPNYRTATRSLFALLLLLVIGYQQFLFYPMISYDFHVLSIQPDYNEVFSIIKSEKRPDDVIISFCPALHRIYLGEEGEWLPKGNRRQEKPDFYTGIDPINTLDQLIDITRSHHGFVVIDGEAPRSSLTNRVRYIVDNPHIKLEYHSSGYGQNADIWLYRF